MEMRKKGSPLFGRGACAPTGYRRLDSDEYRPSALGDALRRLRHRMRHGEDPGGTIRA